MRIRDLLRYATGQAAIFDPDPIEANGSRTGLADDGDADSGLLTSLRKLVALERLNPLSNCLDGEWVNALLTTGPVCKPGRDFSDVMRSDDRFEALMAYFHIDRTQAYLQSLGFTNLVNRPLQANLEVPPPGQPGDDNSFYDPATGQITFGAGGIDDAEDPDVIVHEYGHAIQDSQVPGFGASNDAAAMGEGWGDYLEADMSATYNPSPNFDPCVAEWDAFGLVPPMDCLRRVDRNSLTLSQVQGATCVRNGELDPHCVGDVWSSALWAIRAALGGPAADRLIIQSHFSLTAGATFTDGSLALLAADQALYGGANQALLRNVLSTRGLVDLEHLDDNPAGASPLAVPGQTTGTLDSSSDVRDLYKLQLTAGQGVLIRSTGGGDFDLRLYAPGATSVSSATIVAGATTLGTASESFAYVPPASGIYILDITAASGAGGYTIEDAKDTDGDKVVDSADNCANVANSGQQDLDRDGLGDACDAFPRDPANDVDHDGRGANADNCPRVANRSQADWDRDRKGDACDRSSRIVLSVLAVRGRTAIVQLTVQPRSANPRRTRLLVQRQICSSPCHYGKSRTVSATRRVSGNRVRLTFHLPRAGRYRLRALLTDTRYNVARSRVVNLIVRK